MQLQFGPLFMEYIGFILAAAIEGWSRIINVLDAVARFIYFYL